MTSAGPLLADDCLHPGVEDWLDSLTDAVVILSPVYGGRRRIVDFRIEYANASALALGSESGQQYLRAGAFFGSGFLDFTHPGARQLASLLHTVLTTGVSTALDGVVYETLMVDRRSPQECDIRVSRHGDRLLLMMRDATERRRSDEEARRSDECLRALADRATDEALVTIDVHGHIMSWNAGAQRMYGYSAAEIAGAHYSVLYPCRWSDGSHSHRTDSIVDERGDGSHETWHARQNGETFLARVSITPVHDARNELRGFSAITRDLTEEVGNRLRGVQLEVSRVLNHCSSIDVAADAVLELTATGLGAALSQMLVAQPADWSVGSTWRRAFPQPTLDALLTAPGCENLGQWDELVSQVRSSGAPVTVSDLAQVVGPDQAAAAAALGLRCAIACPINDEAAIVGVLVYFFATPPRHDRATPETVAEIGAEVGRFLTRTRAHATLQEQALRMEVLASTDPLTGLKNRREFDRMIGTTPRRPFAILAIDVDNLKRVNDEHGHESGDLALRTIGTTLALMLRGWDVVARVGGDEFAAILLDVDAAEAATAAQRLRAAMHLVPSIDARLHISVGWASAPPGFDPHAVWKLADECLYTAKRDGRDRVVGRQVGDDDHPAVVGPSATTLVTDLMAGLPLHSVYQPIVNLNDGCVIGYEALARPHGFGPSDSVEDLFAAVHRSGKMPDLDWLCRRSALSQSRELPASALLFINISVAALLDPLHDVDQMLLLLEWAGRSPEFLVLEIGEHERVPDIRRLRVVLAAYRQAGIRFAVDDLGEGFATTALLTAADAEYVKIARRLTLNSDRKDARSVIETALEFARTSSATVIAEGVENELVSGQIRLMGIPYGQGFGLGRPSMAADIPDALEAWNARATLRPLRPRSGPPPAGAEHTDLRGHPANMGYVVQASSRRSQTRR